MKHLAVVLAIILAIDPTRALAQLSVQTIDVTGDSISKGFNAGNSFPCSNGDQEGYNWLTSDTHGNAFCAPGSEGVLSVLERLECDAGLNVRAPLPNHAASGATLVRDFATQAGNVRTYLSAQPAQRLAVVFLGHNDNCSGSTIKANASCSSTDLDPANYCRSTPAAFERELRRGLDTLMSIGDTRVGIVSPIRVSQLCNFGTKSNCQVGGSCQFLWGAVNICGSLTRGCSPTRIVDSYLTLKAYHDTLRDVAAEYAAIPDFGSSRTVFIGGQTVGGGTKAPGTTFVYTDAPWYYRFKSAEISCCDCFHPSGLGQDVLARMLKSGFVCSRNTPCCLDTGDPLADGKCAFSPRRRLVYPGLLSSAAGRAEITEKRTEW